VEEVPLAGAVAETAVIEHEGREAAVREALGESTEAIAPRPRQAVRHHHDRRFVVGLRGAVEPRRAGILLDRYLDLLSSHEPITSATPET
jgi:hypothetical protein